MARPIEYNKDDILFQCMEIFWKKGYESTSISDLVTVAGVNRCTLYAIFGDKKGLFDQVMSFYLDKVLTYPLSILRDHPGKEGILKFFEIFQFSKGFKGCLYTNTASEKHSVEKSAVIKIKDFFLKIEKQLKLNLKACLDDGDLCIDVSKLDGICKTMVCLVFGLGSFGKISEDVKDSDLIVDSYLKLLGLR
ncbi:TetR/AcrR family transcriptional regulator [bacterium]|nr:TetR/AcrR family transcriptional regulator [bacterium]